MKVLIVDDEPNIRNLLSLAVEDVGCEQLDMAESGEEALALALQTHYDLVTLDIQMPGVSGLDTLPVMRHAMPRAVIVIISGYAIRMSEAQQEDVDLVIEKPFRLNQIQRLMALAKEVVSTRTAIRALGESGED